MFRFCLPIICISMGYTGQSKESHEICGYPNDLNILIHEFANILDITISCHDVTIKMVVYIPGHALYGHPKYSDAMAVSIGTHSNIYIYMYIYRAIAI